MKYCLVGLGNPNQYKGTRHNIGKDFIYQIVEVNGGKWEKTKKALSSNITLGDTEVTCLISKGCMNTSGRDLKQILKKFDKNKIIVFYDEVDIPVGEIKVSHNSSSGGHKGVESVINQLRSKEFFRVRIGVGKEEDLSKYVLDLIPPKELDLIRSALCEKLPVTLDKFFSDDFSGAIGFCNKKIN